MASVRGHRVENQPSKLLNDEENKKLFELLGYRCVVCFHWARAGYNNCWVIGKLRNAESKMRNAKMRKGLRNGG